MKKIFFLLIMLTLLGCEESDNDISSIDSLENKLIVFQKNTDSNTSDIYTKVYEASSETGEILKELGGYPRIQARTYYDVVYFKNEILTKRSTGEIIRFNLNNGTQTITKFDDSIYNLVVVDNRLFGTKYNADSVDLVEIDEFGNVISVIDTYKVIPTNPSNNRTGLYRITFSQEEKLLIVSRRLSFLNGAKDKLYIYDVNSRGKKEVEINHYQSIISGKNGRFFALKAQYSLNLYHSKLIEFDKNTGKELKDIYTFDYYLSDSDELVYFPKLNQILVERKYNSINKIDVNTGKLISTRINYEYRFLGGLYMTR